MHIYIFLDIYSSITKTSVAKKVKFDLLELHLLAIGVFVMSTIQSKNAVCANVKHNRYFHLEYNFRSVHSHGKMLFGHMFAMINLDNAFSY